MLPLEGVKVLDLSRLLPGEFCSMLLGDFGAEIIKVEDTVRGDYCRWNDPMFTDTMMDDTISAYFAVLNRNKKSIKLNLKHPLGREALLKLAADADVVLESFRPGVMDRLGVGYDTLRDINPRIIYCAITGYGQNGPYRDKAGHDLNYLAIAGVLGMQGIRNGKPVMSGVQIADIGGGVLMAFSGILLALMARSQTGKGQLVDIAMLDGAVSWLAQHAGNFWGNGKEPRRGEMNLNGGHACYNVYRAKDGKYLALGSLEEKFWTEFCSAVGREDLVKDHLAGLERQAELIMEVQEIFEQKTSAEWVKLFENYDTCVTPVNELKDVFADPQVVHRKMVEKFTYRDKEGSEKTLYQLGIPIKLSDTPGSMRLGPPQYGEHTYEILTELGYSREAIVEMVK